MRRLFIVLYLVTALLHGLVAVLLAALLRAWLGGWSWLPAMAIALLLAWAFVGRLQLMRSDHPVSWLRGTLEELYFVHWCSLLPWLPLTLLAGLCLLLIELPTGPGWSWVAGWSFIEQALALGYVPALLMSLWSVMIRRRWVRVRHVPVHIEGLPQAFAGYRIAQLSDLHLGSMCPRRRVARWVARTNALDVDLVALTGDYVTSGVRFHHDIAASLGRLKGRDGVFAVMGNHDYYGNGQPLISLLREEGIRLLRNERTYLKRQGQRLAIAGVDDVYTRRIDIGAALADHPRDEPLLMLAHDPISFEALARRGVSLVLSGHTHWGQVGLPFAAERFNYARWLARHHAGLMRLDAAQLYVHPGLGTTGPPLRFGTWPEITVLELRPAAS